MDKEEQAQQSQYASAVGQTETFGRPAAASNPAGAGGGPDVAAHPARSIRVPKLRGIKWRWVLAGVAVLVAAGAAFAAWSYFNAPQRIIGQAFSKLAEVKTMRFDASATSQLKGLDDFGSPDGGSGDESTSDDLGTSVSVVPVAKAAEGSEKDENNSKDGSPIDVTVGAKGVTDVTNPEEVKTAATITLAGKIAKVTLLSAGIDVKSIGTTGYLKLNDFTDASSFGAGDVLKPLRGQWIRVDEQDVSEATAAESGEKPDDPLTLPDREKVKKLTTAADKSKLITFRQLPDDSIDGQPAHHYGYTIDKQHLEAFIPQANQIISGKPLSEAEIKEIADVFKSVDFNEGEIWIGKQDTLPHKVTLGIKSNIDFLGDIVLSLTMSDFDQAVKIDAPEDAKTFEELEKQLMQESFGGSVGGSAGKDSDGDGHSDSEEIRNGFDPYGPGRQPTQEPWTGNRNGYEY